MVLICCFTSKFLDEKGKRWTKQVHQLESKKSKG